MKEKPTFEQITRRNFLKQAALFSLAVGMPPIIWSCSNKKDEEELPDLIFDGEVNPPFSVWKEMLQALETSPDYLPSRMKRLIAEKNPEAMFHFVRDEIQLIPNYSNSFWQMYQVVVYGIRGVLRYGYATPREKVELLNYMYTEAGLESEILTEGIKFSDEEVQKFLFRPINREFKPNINKKLLKRWEKQMNGKNLESKVVNIDSGFKETKKLSKEIWNALHGDENIKGYEFNFLWNSYYTPLVSFKDGEETKYAHLFDPTVPFGEKKDKDSNVHSIDKAKYYNPDVILKLSYRTAFDRKKEVPLIEGKWETNDLFGRQVVISFMKTENLMQQVSTNPENIRFFTPALALQGLDIDQEFMQEHSFLGDSITLDGKQIHVDDDKVYVNGNEILQESSPELQKKITEIEIETSAKIFPLVKLNVKPLDENGEMITGLSVADFVITDNQKQMPVLMENNQSTPKVLIMFDTSLSMPKQYADKEMDDFIERLENFILEQYPATQITKWETGSSLYTWAEKGSLSDQDLIIFATDGDNNDSVNERQLENYKQGPPILVLNVRNSTDYGMDAFNNIANYSSGKVINAEDQGETLESIRDYLNEMNIAPYVFSYYATDPEAKHTVKISADEGRVQNQEDYTFDFVKKKEDDAGEQIIGVYLDVISKHGNSRRTLAGWDPVRNNNRAPNLQDANDVRSLFLGGLLLAVEGHGPTLSLALHELLQHRLLKQSWMEPVMKGDFEAAHQEFDKGTMVYDERMLTLMAPLSEAVTKESITFQAGLRMGLFKYKIDPENGVFEKDFDYLDTSQYVTAAADPKKAFKINIEKTAQLALLENSLFDNTTYKALESKKIQATHDFEFKDWSDQLKLNESDYAYWRSLFVHSSAGTPYFNLVDPTGSEKAFWQVDKKTGQLLARLPDMSGGGIERIQKDLAELQQLMSTYNAILGITGVGSTPLGVVAAYGMMLAKLYAAVSEAIILMDAGGLDDQINLALAEFACDVIKTITLGVFQGPGDAIGLIDDILGAMGGDGIPGMHC